MSELPGAAAVGIESVEWLDAGGGNLTVRITGRWRRRRGRLGLDTGPTNPTMLVVESEGHRHRFPAIPEPPSVDGAAPGMWRLSFSVPASIAPGLGHTWLSFGTVTVPLPTPASRAAAQAVAEALQAEQAGAQPPGVEQPAAQPPADAGPQPSAEPAGVTGERTLSSLTERLAELERELAEAHRGHDQALASLAARERRRRVAEQRAHAEEALRRDLAHQLADGAREAARVRQAMGELATAEDRIRELENELSAARRAGDEAEQLAGAAVAARERAERALREQSQTRAPAPPPAAAMESVSSANAAQLAAAPGERARLDFEETLRARRPLARPRVPDEPRFRAGAQLPGAPVDAGRDPQAGRTRTDGTEAEAAGPAGQSAIVNALRRELDGRARAETSLRARLIDAESRLAARVLIEQRTRRTLGELRTELAGLTAALLAERERRHEAEAETARLSSEVAQLRAELGGERDRTRDASTAIDELRGTLEVLRAPTPTVRDEAQTAGSSATGAVSPQAFSDALTRLRANAEPRETETETGQASASPAEAAGVSGPAGAGGAGGLVEVAALVEAAAPSEVAPPSRSLDPDGAMVAPLALVPLPTRLLGRPTVEAAFRRLLARDADGAGRLLLGLLASQRAAYQSPAVYDLVLGPGLGCVQVTAGPDQVEVVLHGAAREPGQVDFQVVGNPARIARLVAASRLRRLLRVGLARVTGRREGLDAVRALLALPLDLAALQATGLWGGGDTVLRLLAAMIDPAWTRGESFTIAYAEAAGAPPVHLTIADGQPPLVSRAAPDRRVATTVTGTPPALVALLGGDASSPAAASAQVTGDRGPLTQLHAWASRAGG